MIFVKRLLVRSAPHRLAVLQTVVLLFVSFVIFTGQAGAVIRFNDRSLYIANSTPGATTTYKLSFTYNNQAAPTPTVGSIDLLFCNDPIPSEPITADNPVDHHPCVTPAGLDVSGAVLSSQTGETGFTILSASNNHIVLTRAPGAVNETPSTYTFTNIVNPTDTSQSFAIRMSDYASTDTSGSLINLGSILSQVADGIVLETQVPPMLIFCLAQQVNQDCGQTNGVNYQDLGNVDPTSTLKTTSQFAVGTNASNGYVVTVNGPTMEAGSHVIDALTTPTLSAPGNSQFGINLVQNSQPALGADPDGAFANAVAAPGYDTPNLFKYQDGDVVASAPNVSLVRRFTTSYIVNTPPDLRAGVYTTTLTYICSGRF